MGVLAAPEAPSAAPEVASAAPEVAPSAAPPAATPPPGAPEVDLTKLAARQGYLFVRSSVSARVFVMANDVGETNTPLIVNCGTKFIRLGRALGEFIEPGDSAIIKCGALTELSREPR